MKYTVNKFSKFLVLGLVALVLTACPKDDDGMETVNETGEASFTVTGDVNREESGTATHILLENEPGVVQVWWVLMKDASPQTFTLEPSLMTTSGAAEAPKPGTYQIGEALELQDMTFQLIYNHFPDGNFENKTEYSTHFDGEGTLTIHSVEGEWVTASYEVTAHTYDDNFQNIEGTVTIAGSFTSKLIPNN
ncbi:hypothetical protein [uncultured Planktosalinus sp.]|uniref:hypothetical protein n=1 Tax=uncultured Planktosalinus sp. TaxID=1810935 RepID=UPI0030DBF026